MSDNEHSVGFYMLESYRLDKTLSNLRAQKRNVQTSIEHFAVLYKMAEISFENKLIQEQISAQIKKKINRAETLAFLSHNCANAVKLILRKLNIQKCK